MAVADRRTDREAVEALEGAAGSEAVEALAARHLLGAALVPLPIQSR
jgi:hypothetical protein